MLLRERISLRILDAAMTDWDFKDYLLQLSEEKIKEIVVLPSYLRRAKQLLSFTDIKIGTVIDYPLGVGTTGKKAFEVGQAFRDGADFLELTISPVILLGAEAEELSDALRALAVAWGEIRLQLDTTGMKELTKIECAQRIKKLGWRYVVLGEASTIEEAVHNATIFEYDGGKQLILQINVEKADPAIITELVQQGINYFGVRQVDLADLSLAIQKAEEH